MSNQIRERTVQILYILATCILAFKLIGLDRFTSLSFHLGIAFSFLLWVESTKLTKIDFLLISMLWLALFNILISLLLNDTNLSASYFEKYIHFASTCVLFAAAAKTSISEKTAKVITKLNTVIAALFVLMFYLDPRTVYMMKERVTDYLTFRISNPNATALFLLCVAIREFLSMIRAKKAASRIIHGVLHGYMVFFIYETQSRTSLLALNLFWIMYLIFTVRKINTMRMSKLVTTIIVILPLAFVVGYFVVLESNWAADLFSFMVYEGKGLDSRVLVWKYAFQYILSSPLIGAYGKLGTLVRHLQMHNTHLDVWVSYGVIVLVMFCVFLYQVIQVVSERCKTKQNFMELVGFFAAIFVGAGEAAMVSGGLGIYIYIAGFLLMTDARIEEPELLLIRYKNKLGKHL